MILKDKVINKFSDMKFSEIYKSNKAVVEKNLRSLWCSGAVTETQERYRDQINKLISEELFAPANAMPLVQCMEKYKSVELEHQNEAENLVTVARNGENLWKKSIANSKDSYYPPYEHQYKSWYSLLSEQKSMVVKTGTGSGKTECFMLPLVKDLCEVNKTGEIQAIFLYPLNALMEDQKKRLHKILDGTGLSFVVYNGNLPDQELDGNGPEVEALRERIEQERKTYPNTIVATRQKMRQTPPNIMLTNPTMLEYMLLRNKDQVFFEKQDGRKRQSLRWIVIDEAHTYTGAAAAELSMLIRRVLEAFGQDASTVRFAASSATIGNGIDSRENELNLQKFISDITGAALDSVVVVDGQRNASLEIENNEIRGINNLLLQSDFIKLDDLIKGDNLSIEERLEKLDEMCDSGLRAKVHFFYRVPNNGLRVKLEDYYNGVWSVKHQMDTDDDTPYLELYRCQHCGEFIAVGETVKDTDDKYKALSVGDTDLFDFDVPPNPGQKLFFALKTESINSNGGDMVFNIKGDTYKENKEQHDGWNIVANVRGLCPCCHNKLLGDKAGNNEEYQELEKHGKSIRISSSSISRVLAPSLLPYLRKSEENQMNKPHFGQQFISFVDSRQAAARGTLLQNIEEEKMWVYSRLYYKLNKMMKNLPDDIDDKIKKLRQERENRENEGRDVVDLSREITELNGLKSGNPPYLTWMKIYNILSEDQVCNQLCYQFIKKTEGSEELNTEDDTVDSSVKMRYVQTVMIELLSKRSMILASPESMGLFTSYYPKLNDIRELPAAVMAFNNKFQSNIALSDWKDYLKIFLDMTVRSNQSVYLKDMRISS